MSKNKRLKRKIKKLETNIVFYMNYAHKSNNLKKENEELKRQIKEIKLSYNIFFWAVITLIIFGIKIITGGANGN